MKFISDAESQDPFEAGDRETHSPDAGSRKVGTQFSPAQFLKEAGTLIAVCLGLGVIIQVILT